MEFHFLNGYSKVNNEINHIDGIKEHNYVWNLEWTSRRDNIIHAENNGLINHKSGEMCGHNVYSEKQVREVCKLIENNLSVKDIHLMTKVSKGMIKNILYKKHG